ncbi:MAG: hypothetical protein O3B24_00890 [Verrucomicrobia bacterium]|nr:hypothetical protein [Verrucomicrobiota bacterium]
MSDSLTDTNAAPTETPAERELVLELNFVPEWARKPPNATSFFRDRPGGRRPSEDHGGRRDPRGRTPDRGRPGGGDRGGNRRTGPGQDRDRPRTHQAAPRHAPVQRLPFRTRFLPDDRQIGVIVKRIRSGQRAYPIGEIVGLFLDNPDACRVKLESADPNLRLFQCTACGLVALDRQELDVHILGQHLPDFFDVEKVVGEPATGKFVCVAKCGLSGTLLGPPNHNAYAERVEEVHRTSYAHMSLDEYRRSIQTLHDEALIEQWKEESRTQTLYRPKGQPSETPGLKWSAAVSAFRKQHADTLVRQAAYATLPVAVARQITHAGLHQTLADAWMRECRSPRDLPLAIQGALHGRHMHLFRAGAGQRFVTAIPPAPLAPDRAIESIRAVLLHLRAHPGCTRAQLLADLLPGAATDGPEAAAILSPLGWLVERGHIIEFFNGTMAVPMGKS